MRIDFEKSILMVFTLKSFPKFIGSLLGFPCREPLGYFPVYLVCAAIVTCFSRGGIPSSPLWPCSLAGAVFISYIQFRRNVTCHLM